MRPARPRPATLPARILPPALLACLGTLAGLAAAEAVLRLRPQILPATVPVDPPVRRVRAWRDETYDVRLSDGDIYHWRRAEFRPIPPGEDAVLARVRFRSDAHGFRNAPPDAGAYPVVVVGDSFTEAGNAPVAWPERLAEHLGEPVLNLGESGAGPQHALRNLAVHPGARRPATVILAWFEGNDLLDAGAWDRMQPLLVVRAGRHLIGRIAAAVRADGPAAETAARRFPLRVTIAGQTHEMAFWPGHISLLSVDRSVLSASQNHRIAREAIAAMRDRAVSTGARFVIAYLPCRTRVYLPLLDPAQRARLLDGLQGMALDEEGFLTPSGDPADPGITRTLDHQADLIASLAREEGIAFMDLTPAFRAEASRGTALHYPYDTHWNQVGHDLAATTIARALREGISAGAPPSSEGIPAATPRATTSPP